MVPGRLPQGGASRENVIAESVRVLNELCDIAANYDVWLAFEFLGQPDCSVPTLDLAAEIVRKVGRQNLGFVIDSFHFYAGGSTFEMIDALDPKLIQIFHINDAEDLPREQLEDQHRLLPGSEFFRCARSFPRSGALATTKSRVSRSFVRSIGKEIRLNLRAKRVQPHERVLRK